MAVQHGATPEFRSWDIAMIDIVGYSTLSEEGQLKAINRLTGVVRNTAVIRATTSDDRLFLPTGDGMAVGFAGRPARPLELASQIHKAYGADKAGLKIGIHSGIAFEIIDINGNKNIAGSGINFAQRTLSCCRGGHILVAADPAEKLKNSDTWRDLLRGPYGFQVKHSVHLTAYNYCAEGVGTPSEDFNNLASLPSYEPLKERLTRLGITATGKLASASQTPPLKNQIAIDDIILEAPILGFQGVDPSDTVVTMISQQPDLPEYVRKKKASIPEPDPNRPKVYLAHFVSPLSDEKNRLGLHIGLTDFWTSIGGGVQHRHAAS